MLLWYDILSTSDILSKNIVKAEFFDIPFYDFSSATSYHEKNNVLF